MTNWNSSNALALVPGSSLTPIYVKLADDAPWPRDAVFFMLSCEGLHLCRNHAFFRSAVPAPYAPSELAAQRTFLDLHRCPRIPQPLIEQAVGFFYAVYRESGSEAGLLLVWNDSERRMRLVCPEQTGLVSISPRGRRFPASLKYTIPSDLRRDDRLLGDLHSHADEAAYASARDRSDETMRTGVHVVIGRLSAVTFDGTPDFHVDVVADGSRFRVKPPERIFQRYEKPDHDFPRKWMEKLQVEFSSGWTAAPPDSPSSP